jgi:hypothetical protein
MMLLVSHLPRTKQGRMRGLKPDVRCTVPLYVIIGFDRLGRWESTPTLEDAPRNERTLQRLRVRFP